MRAPRLSIAGLMILVGVVALDCATLFHGLRFTDGSLGMAIFLLIGVLPLVNVAGVGMLLVLQPPARR